MTAKLKTTSSKTTYPDLIRPFFFVQTGKFYKGAGTAFYPFSLEAVVEEALEDDQPV